MVTNNETYFFRETHQFDLLVNHVIPERRAALRARPLRILSAGCSSGEEPYSLSHRAAQRRAAAGRRDVGDRRLRPQSRAHRAGAGRASIRESSLRGVRRRTRGGATSTRSRSGFRLREKYRKGVRCFHANLLAPNGSLGWAIYDAILCRNLLIYFSDDAFASLIALFGRCLVPGGYLFLGHSESLLDRKTAFVPAMVGGAVVYRKLRRPRDPRVPGGRLGLRAPGADAGARGRAGVPRSWARPRAAPRRWPGSRPRSPTWSRSTSPCPAWTGCSSCRRCCAGSRRSRC